METFVKFILLPVTVSLAIVASSVAGMMIYREVVSDKFSLQKDEWVCTQEHTETRPQMTGKVMITVVRTVCNQWTRK